jgi:hypothetical protein
MLLLASISTFPRRQPPPGVIMGSAAGLIDDAVPRA